MSPDSEQTKPRLHLPFLDGMRGLAALYVVLHHAFLQSWPNDALQAGLRAQLAARPLLLLNYGHYAVTVFVVISGFCLALPVVRKRKPAVGGTATFFYRRAKRILPPYYAAVILGSLLTLGFRHVDLTRYYKSAPVTGPT